MTYTILDRDSIPGYLASIPRLAERLGDTENLVINEVGDGNLNFVYRIYPDGLPEVEVVLKQAVPYLRMVGDEWPLARDRMTFEIRALQLYNEVVPALVPEILHADEEMSVVVMQCLQDHIILRNGNIDAIEYPVVVDHITTFLAETLFKTSSLYLESEAKRRLMDRFTLNTELCKLTEEFIFSFPHMDHESNYSNPTTDRYAADVFRRDDAYTREVLRLKDLFMNKTDALVHGDLHTGSLMVNQDETYVIDMEFAFMGPFGFDVGKIMANFLLAAISHFERSEGTAYQDWLLQGCIDIWSGFQTKFRALWDAQSEDAALVLDGMLSPEGLAVFKDETMRGIFRDAVGFAGCSCARRSVGIAGVADIRSIEDEERRAELEIAALELSHSLVSHSRKIAEIGDLEDLVRNFFAERAALHR